MQSEELNETKEPEAPEAEAEDEVDVSDDEVEDELAAVAPAEDDEETSLEELLAQRAARRTPDEADEEGDDIMALTSQKEPSGGEPLPSRVIPIRDKEEFVCSRCHLVKARSQLADESRLLCRDCV
jgi:hypothetical protein